MIARSQVDWITEAGMFFERQGPVWDTLRGLDERLRQAGLDYVVIGGLALNAHDYPRQTIDVDVVMTREGYEAFEGRFADKVYRRHEGAARRFIDPDSEVSIDVLIAGDLAGRRSKNPSVRFPEPAEAIEIAGLRTVSLPRLIELKLVTWRYKDWGDVVELIRRHNLSESFAEQLDPVTQGAYQQCWDQAHDEEYEGASQ